MGTAGEAVQESSEWLVMMKDWGGNPVLKIKIKQYMNTEDVGQCDRIF